MDKKVLTKDRIFSTRLPYAKKNFGEIYYSTVNTIYKTTEIMISE